MRCYNGVVVLNWVELLRLDVEGGKDIGDGE